jgi:hypothetical protein
MKNLFKLLGIIAIAAVIGFGTAACGGGDDTDNDDGTNNGGSNSGGNTGGNNTGDNNNSGTATLILSGKVYLESYNEENGTSTYTPYNGSHPVENYRYNNGYVNNGGTGSITNGNLTFVIGTPSGFDNESILRWFTGGSYNNLQISNGDVKSSSLYLRIPGGQYNYGIGSLQRGKEEWNVSGNTGSGFEEGVEYVYVDRDVTISGKGKTTPSSGSWEDEEGNVINYTGTGTTKDINITFKTGWNAICIKEEGTETRTENTVTYTRTLTYSMVIPDNLNWTLFLND